MRTPHRFSLPVLALLSAYAFAGDANASYIAYKEIFPADPNAPALPESINPTQAANVDQLINEGWYGGNTGDNFETSGAPDNDGGEGAIGGGAPFAPEMTPVNSNPQGPFPASFYAFTSQRAISNLFLYTTEFSIDSSALKKVTWDSRNSRNVTNSTTSDETTVPDKWSDQGSIEAVDSHIALRIIDGANNKWWHISQEGFLHMGDSSTWLTNVADIGSLSWFLFDQGPSDGSTLPGTNFTGLADLPDGTVDAFGLFTSRSGANIRIDNYAIWVPEPASLSLLGLGLAGLGFARRRKAA